MPTGAGSAARTRRDVRVYRHVRFARGHAPPHARALLEGYAARAGIAGEAGARERRLNAALATSGCWRPLASKMPERRWPALRASAPRSRRRARLEIPVPGRCGRSGLGVWLPISWVTRGHDLHSGGAMVHRLHPARSSATVQAPGCNMVPLSPQKPLLHEVAAGIDGLSQIC